MKVLKWICRYAFFALLLAGAVLWCIKCNETAGRYEDVSEKVEFIDAVIDNFDDAVAIRERAAFFRDLFTNGVIAASVVTGLLVLMIMWNVFGGRITARFGRARKKREDATVYSHVSDVGPHTEPQKIQNTTGGFCTGCGMHFDTIPEFCTNCGAKQK